MPQSIVVLDDVEIDLNYDDDIELYIFSVFHLGIKKNTNIIYYLISTQS